MSFSCRHPGCDRSYMRKEHLLRHEKDHANLRSHVCQYCPASFNRSDLLNRHVSMTHGSSTSHPVAAQPGPPDGKDKHDESNATANDMCSQAENDDLPFEEILLGLDTNVDRRLLVDAYFQRFHPHWPILHPHSFRTTRQPRHLLRSVLVVGLWMMEPHRSHARKHHDKLLRELDRELTHPLENDKLMRPTDQRNVLTLFQSLLLPLILCTYRDAEVFPSCIVNAKHLFQAFQQLGFYDQRTDDAAHHDPTIKEQYQRLVLIHFKCFVHLNSLFVFHFPQFKPFEYLHPRMLRLMIPSASVIWDAAPVNKKPEEENRVLVSDLFEEGILTPKKYSALSLLASWDFTTGMIIGCYLTQKKDEGCAKLLQRMEPFLFLHKSDT